MRKRSLALIKSLAIDPDKHKATVRELCTLGRSMDHLIRMLATFQKKSPQKTFAADAEHAEIWRSLDVQAQRWAALEFVLSKQAQDASAVTSKIWASLKHFELEPPFAATTVQASRLEATQSAAVRDQKLFGDLATGKKN